MIFRVRGVWLKINLGAKLETSDSKMTLTAPPGTFFSSAAALQGPPVVHCFPLPVRIDPTIADEIIAIHLLPALTLFSGQHNSMSVLGGHTDGAWSLVCLLFSPSPQATCFRACLGQQRLLHRLRLPSHYASNHSVAPHQLPTLGYWEKHRSLEEKRVLVHAGCIYFRLSLDRRSDQRD